VHRPFQVLRIVSTGPQEDGVHRLCLKGLRLHGTARVDLMTPPAWGGGPTGQQPLVLAPGSFRPLHAAVAAAAMGAGKGSRPGTGGGLAMRASAG